MKVWIAATALLTLAAALSGCGSDSKSTTTPAASAAAPTKAAATTPSATTAGGTTPGATKASPSTAAATSAPASSGGGTCKYISASEASALLANPGDARVTSADTPAAKQTTCAWGVGANNRIILIVNEVKMSAALTAIKDSMNADMVEKIAGLGDVGGFQTKDPAAVTVTFIKGSTAITLSVSADSVDADAVAAAAKKIAAGL